jgi:type I site-specific restriction-modification system R (restriction) subunit
MKAILREATFYGFTGTPLLGNEINHLVGG